MALRDFVINHVDADERAAQAADNYPFGDTHYFADQRIAGHYARHSPDLVLRRVAADRSVIDRHFTTDNPRFTQYCNGCGEDPSGGLSVPLEECEELQGIAWRWHDDPEWDRKWCPHYETDRHEITSHADPRKVFMKTCHHCGTGLGRIYGDPVTDL